MKGLVNQSINQSWSWHSWPRTASPAFRSYKWRCKITFGFTTEFL